MVEINGTVAQGFERVADAFRGNFEEFPELGAGFALYADGELQVDLWGGVADKTTGRAWDDTTLQLVFSTTKGAAAICVARLVDAGKLSYDDTVASHWPEFAANGKESITVAQMMSHQAGLPYVDRAAVTRRDARRRTRRRGVGRAGPVWEPGTDARLPRSDLRLARR